MSHPNTFIQNLSESDAVLLSSAFTTREFPQGEVVAEPGDPIEQVLFMHNGLISVVVPLESGEAIEAGVIGREEVFGACGALGAKSHVSKAIVQMPGTASVIKTADLTKLARQSNTLLRALVVHEQFLLAQAQQTAACNARHEIPQRLATWLLRVSDRSAENEMPLTQEFLAQMLGVQRASVTIAAGALRDAGLISYRRGRIVIDDRAKLEKLACECYSAIRTQYERTIGSVDDAPKSAFREDRPAHP
jgi:CRP-like cAMP-binding protein